MRDPEAGVPAFPVPDTYHHNGKIEFGTKGMTLQQYAAIKLRIPASGIDWLDEMIFQAKRDELAKAALQGLIAKHGAYCEDRHEHTLCDEDVSRKVFESALLTDEVVEYAYALSDAMLKAGKP